MYLKPLSWSAIQLLHFLHRFMGKNHARYRKDGSKRIADNALVAITLMLAESNPADKEIMVKLINSRN
jgi:hypothetical protein